MHNPIDKIECDTSSWDCKLQSNPIVSDLSVQINRLNTDDVRRTQYTEWLTVAESFKCEFTIPDYGFIFHPTWFICGLYCVTLNSEW